MSSLTTSVFIKPEVDLSESVLVKTTRLTLNLLTNIFLCVTVLVCLLFACSSEQMNKFYWHIVLCVLGYEFFMCQGILMISKYNSWSMYLHRDVRKRLHILFQLIGFVLVIIGTSLIMTEKSQHFDTVHGTLGICALITSGIAMLNGLTAQNAYKISRPYSFWIKFVHYISGILTLFLSAASLSAAFEELSFRTWASNENCVAALILIMWLFTLFVALDFWLATASRLGMLR